MKPFLFKHIKLIEPQHPLHKRSVDILIESGNIKEIEKGGQIKAGKSQEVFEEKGAYISPGWFDMQVNLSDPGYEYKETLEDLNQAALSGGFTGMLCYPNTDPVVDNSQMLRSLIQQSSSFPVDFFFSGAVSHACAGKELAEIYEMHEVGAKAFTDGMHPVRDAGLLLRALQYMRSFEGLIIDCPLDQSLVGAGQMHEGAVSTSLGMKGIPSLAETMAISRQLQLLEYSPGRMHIQPLSSSDALAMLQRTGKRQKNLTTGTAIHYLCMSDEDLKEFDANYKLFPPLRSRKDVQQLKKALAREKIDVLTSGHQAQGLEEKNVQFEQAEPGMLALQTFYSQANKHLIQEEVIDLEAWVKLVSINPREVLRIPPISINKGESANLTVFHPNMEWELSPSDIASRAKNTPLLGSTQKGKVLGVFKDESFYDMR